jgi:hypothetical protein
MTRAASPAPRPSLAALARRLSALEAEHAIRATMARYMALCDVPEDAGDGASLAELFADDAIWEGIGPQYTQKFGILRGPVEIVAMLRRYLPPEPHFAVNAHFLTSESIEVNGATACGRWIMLQASRYADASAELIAARLSVDFAAADDGTRWLIRHFRTERLLNGPWALARAPQS